MLKYFLRCHDHIWAALHITILNIPPTRLYLFPLLAGTAWLVTLTGLLLRWVTRGMRPYPGQSNPYIPFISDIASFELKPLFLVGASVTAMGIFFTVAAVHVMRYEPGFALIHPHDQQQHQQDHNSGPLSDTNTENNREESEGEEDNTITKSLKLTSLLSIFAAGLASTALTLLSVMDTFRYELAHHVFLRICFAGLAVQSAGTAIVYADEVLSIIFFLSHRGRWADGDGQGQGQETNLGRKIKSGLRVRIFATLSTALILIELFVGIAFLSLTVGVENSSTDLRAAGILEWIIAFLGTGYLWLFVGFFDRRTFHGYIPRILYNSPSPGDHHWSGSGTGDGDGAGTANSYETRRQGNTDVDVDAERAPLLNGQTGSDMKNTWIFDI